MNTDPVIIINAALILYGAIVTGCFIGTVLMARQVVAECRRILREADNRPHGDVPQLPAGWPGKVRRA